MANVNLADVFVGLGNRLADQPAIVAPKATLSYASIVEQASRTARALRDMDIAPGANVGIATSQSADTVVLMVALWMLGATPVPIDFRAKRNERAALASDFDLAAILEERRTPGQGDYRSIIVDAAWNEQLGKYDSKPLMENRPAAPAIISLTSGTTGKPMGLVLEHERFYLQVLFTFGVELVSPGPRMLSAIPISFPASRNRALNRLLAGGTVFFHPPLFSAEELTAAVLTNKATCIFTVPTVIRGLLDIHSNRSSPLFEDVRAMVCGGAPISAEEKVRARAVLCEHYLELFGSSVSGVVSALYGEDIKARPDSVGRVLPNVALQIVDNDDRELPRGEAGAIRLRSPGMANVIYGGEARDSGDRIKDGWIYTGDIGVLDRDGFLTLLGRSSDLIIRGGVNVHPGEVESVIAEIPGVRDVAVVGFSAAREGEEIAAFVVADSTVSEGGIAAHCLARLSANSRPRKFVMVPQIPRNPNGKIMRSALRERLERELAAPAGS